MKYLLLALSLFSPGVLATPSDQYYSTDIFTAIEEARQRTHHYDYSSALRYNRSTSQSIQIPRLMNREMAQTAIQTPDAGMESVTPETAETSRELNNDNRLTQTPSSNALNMPLATGTPSAASVTVTVR